MDANAAQPATLNRSRQRWVVTAVLALHLALVANGGWRHSPCWDEVGHFAAGLHHWQTGDYQWYRVNPPLVRLWATLPVSFGFPRIEAAAGQGVDRPEFLVGPMLIRELGPERTRWGFAVARWACLGFTAMGGLVCWHWARRLHGSSAGLLALWLWCFDPNILANAQMITPDTGATAFGLLAFYLFWEWCRRPDWPTAGLVGIATGLALLCKFTWVVVVIVYPLMWLCHEGRRCLKREALGRAVRQGSGSALLALLVVNAGYRFDGSGTRLGDFQFTTKLFSGSKGDNRFRDTVWRHVPVPLPREFVLGIDRQRRDFETGLVSYLRGEWKHGGWWYYYVYALVIKTPVGTLLLWLAAIIACCSRTMKRVTRAELTALIPAVVVLTFVSSQTGFNHHLRYVLPVLPFLFIFGSRVTAAWGRKGLAGTCLLAALATAESLSVYPHTLSFFNWTIGGPTQGHKHLLDSNVEWGQDLYFLREWMERHPEARPMWSANWGIVDPADLGCPTIGWPPSGFSSSPDVDRRQLGPLPGWYAVGVAALYVDEHPDRESALRHGIPLCGYLKHFAPVDRIGYSMLIYHLTPESVAPIRARLGLPPLNAVRGAAVE